MRLIKLVKKWTRAEQTKAKLLLAARDEFAYFWNQHKNSLLLDKEELSLEFLDKLFRSINPVLRNNVPGFAESDILEQRLSSYMSESDIRHMDYVIRALDEIAKFRDNVFDPDLDVVFRKAITSSARELKNKLQLLRRKMG